ncbi:MAG: WS/DGAT domain-containing protein [Holophagaceae bacterium]
MRTRVSSSDAIWLQETPENLMVINAVLILDRMDLATFRDTFHARLLKDDPAGRLTRLRSRIVGKGAAAHWEVDPDFSVERQIFAPEGEEPTTLDALQAFVGREASRPLPADRPPWQFQLVEHFEGDASALVVRIHHSIADGMALVSLMFNLMDPLGPDPGGRSLHLRPSGGSKVGAGLGAALRIGLGAPGVLLSRLLWRADRHALHGPKLSGRKQVAWTAPLDLHVIKAAKDRLGATVNDVLMAAVSGALTRHLAPSLGEALKDLRVSMPVNVRPLHEPLVLDNRFAAVPLRIPAGLMSLERRIELVKVTMDGLKRSAAPVVVFGLQKALLAFLPDAASRGLIDFLANKCTAVVTNVPGPQQDISLAGRKVCGMLFWVPQRADIGIGISILSFAGKVQVGVMADANLMEDPHHLVHAFEAEFEALKQLA